MASSQTEKKKHPGGRPTIYNQSIAEEICEKIATNVKSLKRLCNENPHWPDRSTIFIWKIRNKEFFDLYHKAKEDQVETLLDEMIETSMDISNDEKINDSGNVVHNSEAVNRSRLKCDTFKWVATKLQPRRYGEKTEHKHDLTVRQEDALKELK